MSDSFNNASIRRLSQGIIGAEFTPGAVGTGLFPFTGGTAATPVTSALGGSFERYFTKDTKAGSDSSRGIYWRHVVSGAGASGEAGRFYMTVNGTGAVSVNGVHTSVGFALLADDVTATGTCAGEANAAKATVMVPAATLGGTVAAVKAELWAEGATSDVAQAAGLRVVLGGNASGCESLDDHADALAFDGGAVGAGNIFHTVATPTATHGLRISVNGVKYDLMLKATGN
jgi:hypothetical protein